jgi:hypothetical protein
MLVSALLAGASFANYIKHRMAIAFYEEIIKSVVTNNKEKLVHTTAEMVVDRVAPRVNIKLVANGVVEAVMN